MSNTPRRCRLWEMLSPSSSSPPYPHKTHVDKSVPPSVGKDWDKSHFSKLIVVTNSHSIRSFTPLLLCLGRLEKRPVHAVG